VKLQALELLQEWVRDVGREAGLSQENAQIISGAVGVPESRLEVRSSYPSPLYAGPYCDIGLCCGTYVSHTCNCCSIAWCVLLRQLEVEFESLAELERFWAAIPSIKHRAWSERVQRHIIDGSPRWEVYRICPVLPGTPAAPEQTPAESTSGRTLTVPSRSDGLVRLEVRTHAEGSKGH
jgi:hypothetical protein